MGSMDEKEATCEGKPVQKVCQSSKNLLLVSMLACALGMMIVAYRCEAAAAAMAESTALNGKGAPTAQPSGFCLTRKDCVMA